MSQMPLGLNAHSSENNCAEPQDQFPQPSHSGGFWGINGGAKRSFDVALSLTALIFLAPLLLLAALGVAFDGGSVFFVQPRIGRGGGHFKMYKFRTMRMDADAVLNRLIETCPASRAEWNMFQKLRQDPRITPIGGFLRRTSIDELPQLLNVLKGDMSVVGVRPILPHQRQAYGEHIESYELARPGLTGLWQVRGRNRLSFADRAALDAEYVRKWTLRSDAWIIVLTVPALLAFSGAY
jgi:lipopolysaccharide/colanic/teichoic acid biosynthesis glycosyltransferase